MKSTATRKRYLAQVKKKISKEMPRVLREVSIYEQKQKHGDVTLNPPVVSHLDE